MKILYNNVEKLFYLGEIMSQQLENYIKDLKQVYYLTSTMQKYTDLKEQLQLMLKECINITKATSGSILFRHKQSSKLFFYVEEGVGAELIAQTNLKVGDGIAGTVVAEGTPKIVNNITLDPKYISMDSRVQAEMAVPIFVNQQVLGVITLDHTKVDQFTDKHLELVQMVCGYTGFMIEHHLQTLMSEKNTRLLENLININTQMSAEEIFKLLIHELKATSACVIDRNGTVLFEKGKLVEKIELTESLFEYSQSMILQTENENYIPYTRIIIPRIQKDITFIADKIYYFSDNVKVDIDFADKILEFLAIKDSQFHSDETLSQWAEHKLDAPEGQVYDLAVGIIEKEIISVALKKFRYNRLKTAKFLGINRNTLRHKMELFGLEK